MKSLILSAAACAAAVFGIVSSAYATTPTVTVSGVKIEGTVSLINSKVDDYFGIPYATAARWQPPVAHAALSNPFVASSPDVDTCPQATNVTIFYGGSTMTLPESENCLTLTVHVPATATPTSKLPVLFYIHGGSLTEGSGLEYFADNTVANNDIIVVTINYRLGALGWLAQKAIAATKANSFQNVGDAGDYGLMDQQFALRWVKANIAAFGGNPAEVTIDGQSAGGLSVGLNLVSTTTGAGLFRGAIIESGAYLYYDVPTLANYETLGNTFVDAVLKAVGTIGTTKCSTLTTASATSEILTCLNGASYSLLLSEQKAVYGTYLTSPASGTLVLPRGLEAAISAGEFNKVRVMQGNNFNEGRDFEPGEVPYATTFATIVAAGGPANYALNNPNDWCGTDVKCTYVEEVNELLKTLNFSATVNTAAFDTTLSKDYPLASYPDQYLTSSAPSSDMALAQIDTDWRFACSTINYNLALSKYVMTFAYEFNDPLAPPTLTNPARTKTPNDQYGYPTGSEHGANLQFLYKFPYTSTFSPDEVTLETEMQTYWANFVKNLNPAVGTAVPAWPNFSSTNENVEKLVPGPTKPAPFLTFSTEHFCTVWNPIIEAE